MMNEKKNNRLRTLALSLAIAMAVPVTAMLPASQATAAVTKHTIISQSFKIEGQSSTIGAINKNGSTYIALRSLNTALGLNTKYNSSTRVVQVNGRGRTMELNLSNRSIYLNGQPLYYGPEAILQDGTTYVPLRFVLEHFGYEVTYEKSSKVIELKAIEENDLTITSMEIGADGDGKSLSVFYPVLSKFKDAKVQQKVNDFLKQEADRFAAEGSKLMNPAVEWNNELLEKDPNAFIRRPSFDGRYTVSYNENGLLSLYVDYYAYLGGAHGDTIRATYTFDLSTGETLSLKEATGDQSDYVTIINKHIKNQIADRDLPLLVPFETIEKDRDFFLSHKGVVVYFTQYEYTSFAEGMPEFVIPFSAFK